MGRIYHYDDQWIREHYRPEMRWKTLLQQYNETFGTDISYPTFVSHMNRELHLQQEYCVPYTAEQDMFLRIHYPKLGKIKVTEKFNLYFNDTKNERSIQGHCTKLGLHVTRKRKAQSCPENHKRSVKVGTVSFGLFKVPAVKVQNGANRKNWVRLDELAIGKKDGCVILHLDGNPENCEPDNLMHVPRSVTGIMAKEGFWCRDPEYTKTAVVWCQLYKCLKKKMEGFNHDYTEG